MPVLRCCKKRYEFEFGWKNRNILIACPYFVLGFVLNVFITYQNWWGTGLEVITITTCTMFWLAVIISLVEVHLEPKLWYLGVFVAELGALVASVVFLVLTFEQLKHSHHSMDHSSNSTQTLQTVNSTVPSIDEVVPSNDSKSWGNWKSCIVFILLSLLLLGNTAASRSIKIEKSSSNRKDGEESIDLQENMEPESLK